jgi:hypothetical protein
MEGRQCRSFTDDYKRSHAALASRVSLIVVPSVVPRFFVKLDFGLSA